ncbi:MAG: RluA family pseudouridine synthase [Proteobacteria bacterium]|nr:RluA family pseudouridine synthase [Verrucomicrobiota bacterium]NBU08105.1 RluA family pseudouridine synthase [Pseudomonadota bacterium]
MIPPCVLHEDEHLLVVNKPSGWNTHSPAPFAGEGIYDWLRHHEPRWANLAIIHRLDKETSGVLVFGKTPLANKSLTEQFERREVSKRYELVTDRPVERDEFTVETDIERVGERYAARPLTKQGTRAETHFRVAQRNRDQTWLEARPTTGRTHQIRVHAAHTGFPILGDPLYGGTATGNRLCLHAAEITFSHPASGQPVRFAAQTSMFCSAASLLRRAFIHPQETDCFRLHHGAADHHADVYVEQLSEWMLAQARQSLSADRDDDTVAVIHELGRENRLRGAFFKLLQRDVRRTKAEEATPKLLFAAEAPREFVVRENGLQFHVSLNEGYSYGLFLDQRDNRRRLLTGHVAADFAFRTPHSALRVLNCFAYTCGFSVAAAKAGAHTTSLDLSKKYLEWGKRNFTLNHLDPEAHDFIYGDVFDWLRRLAKKGRTFDVVLLDPPTFSQSKESGVFRAEKDYGRLVALALPLLRPDGILFASTNCATLAPEEFLATLEMTVQRAGRRITQQHYVPQPPDFPITRDEPAHLKTVWLRIA